MMERDIYFQSGNLRLVGTLTSPSDVGRSAGVLLVGGSGRVDRNQNHETLKTNIFVDIAEHLAGQGFSTLRYDKRGIGLSEGDYRETGFFDYVVDARAALEHLRACREIVSESVFVLGISEGAVVSTRLAGQGANVAGVILVAGPMRSGEEALKWQAQQVMTGVAEVERWERFHTYLKATMVGKWLNEFMNYDPSEDFRRIRAPVLAITGSKDIQANPQDLTRMAQITSGDFEYHEMPDVTHILRREEGEPSPGTYVAQLQQPMDSGVLDCISEWLRKRV